jgi:hypothetical protein
MEKVNLEEFLEIVGGKESDIIEYQGDEALKAVENNGYALRYIKNQTEAICLKAVEKDGLALQYVKDQTVAICLLSVKNNKNAR